MLIFSIKMSNILQKNNLKQKQPDFFVIRLFCCGRSLQMLCSMWESLDLPRG